jgi:hypothetical protein
LYGGQRLGPRNRSTKAGRFLCGALKPVPRHTGAPRKEPRKFICGANREGFMYGALMQGPKYKSTKDGQEHIGRVLEERKG